MKTREEVEALKTQWLHDPCFDLEDAEGFEEYVVELAGFAVEHRKLWKAAREKAKEEAYRDTPASAATLRDMFACYALMGELAQPAENGDGWISTEAAGLATYCYRYADAMMAARKVKP